MKRISCAAVLVLFAFAGTVCEGAAKGSGSGSGSRSGGTSGGMSGSRSSGGMSGGSKPSYPSGGTSRPSGSHTDGGSYRPPVRIVPIPVPIGGSYPQRQPYYPQPQYQPE